MVGDEIEPESSSEDQERYVVIAVRARVKILAEFDSFCNHISISRRCEQIGCARIVRCRFNSADIARYGNRFGCSDVTKMKHSFCPIPRLPLDIEAVQSAQYSSRKKLSLVKMSFIFASGATALITGGASGIGLAIAQHCRKSSMKVAIVDHNETLLNKAKETLSHGSPNEVLTFDMDVGSIDDWLKLKSDITKAWKKIDFLVLNAGIGAKGTWGDTDYFQKVVIHSSGQLLILLIDYGHQSVWSDQRPKHICSTYEGANWSRRNCCHGEQARNHQSSGKSGVQRIKIGGQNLD
jgi:hypothetical protein